MGLARVAVLAADIMAGTAHAGAAVSCGVMAYGVGATTSPTLVGLVAQAFGFPAAFIALLANAAIGLRVWIVRLLLHEHAHDGDQREMPYAKSTG
jgi:sugar phosphate permease